MTHRPTALVTGASSGIGKAFAEVLAQNGCDLILVARSAEKLEELSVELEKKFKVKVHTVIKDLAHSNRAKEVFEEVHRKNIVVDFLINNAGTGLYGKFEKTPWEKEQAMIYLNIVALTHLTKLFVPEMIARKSGRIVNLASTAAFEPGPSMAVYFATKAYVLSFSEALTHELRRSGVTVTALCPGPTASGFEKSAVAETSGLFKGKLPSAADVAEYGYRAMMKGNAVAVHGLFNKLLIFSLRLSPRKLTRYVVDSLMNS